VIEQMPYFTGIYRIYSCTVIIAIEGFVNEMNLLLPDHFPDCIPEVTA
jgi:hypothetical protein